MTRVLRGPRCEPDRLPQTLARRASWERRGNERTRWNRDGVDQFVAQEGLDTTQNPTGSSGGAFLRAGGRPSIGTDLTAGLTAERHASCSSYEYATLTVTYEAVLPLLPQMSRATGRPPPARRKAPPAAGPATLKTRPQTSPSRARW